LGIEFRGARTFCVENLPAHSTEQVSRFPPADPPTKQRSKTSSFGQVDSEAVAAALVAPGHLGCGVAEDDRHRERRPSPSMNPQIKMP
jgi:hypothetical protein